MRKSWSSPNRGRSPPRALPPNSKTPNIFSLYQRHFCLPMNATAFIMKTLKMLGFGSSLPPAPAGYKSIRIPLILTDVRKLSAQREGSCCGPLAPLPPVATPLKVSSPLFTKDLDPFLDLRKLGSSKKSTAGLGLVFKPGTKKL